MPAPDRRRNTVRPVNGSCNPAPDLLVLQHWYYSIADIAARWHCHPARLFYWFDSGTLIPAVLVPKQLLPIEAQHGVSPSVCVVLENFRSLLWQNFDGDAVALFEGFPFPFPRTPRHDGNGNAVITCARAASLRRAPWSRRIAPPSLCSGPPGDRSRACRRRGAWVPVPPGSSVTRDPPGGEGAVLRLRPLTLGWGHTARPAFVDGGRPRLGPVLEHRMPEAAGCRRGQARCARRLRRPLTAPAGLRRMAGRWVPGAR